VCICTRIWSAILPPKKLPLTQVSRLCWAFSIRPIHPSTSSPPRNSCRNWKIACPCSGQSLRVPTASASLPADF
jgi:hypothetical protein